MCVCVCVCVCVCLFVCRERERMKESENESVCVCEEGEGKVSKWGEYGGEEISMVKFKKGEHLDVDKYKHRHACMHAS